MAGNKKIRAAVFDADGMLLDSREFIFQSYEYTLKKYGHDIPERTIIAEQVGRSLADTYVAIAPTGDNDALVATHRAFQDENPHLVVPYPGLAEMLEELKSAGLKLGLFSSRKGGFKKTVDLVGITSYFGAIVDGGMVNKFKPHPEGLLKVLQILNEEPKNASMAGDAVFDIEAGKAAAVSITIGITHGFGSLKALQVAEPDYIVDSLAEIPPILLGKTIKT